MACEGEVESIDNNRFRDNGGVDIIRGGANRVMAGEGIHGGHFSTREDFPDNVKVL